MHGPTESSVVFYYISSERATIAGNTSATGKLYMLIIKYHQVLRACWGVLFGFLGSDLTNRFAGASERELAE